MRTPNYDKFPSTKFEGFILHVDSKVDFPQNGFEKGLLFTLMEGVARMVKQFN